MGAAIGREEDSDLALAVPLTADGAYQLRWAVSAHAWDATLSEWHFLLGLLSSRERAEVEKSTSHDDRKRALLSRLMRRRAASLVFNADFATVTFRHTKGGKPFLDYKGSGIEPQPSAPNFNFNLSHEGHFVVLASEPVLLVGVDVSAPFELRGGPQLGPFSQVRQTFSNVLTDEEWQVVEAEPDDAARVRCFRRHWCLKESYVKARGDGLAFALGRAEFRPCFIPEEAEAQQAAEATGDFIGAWGGALAGFEWLTSPVLTKIHQMLPPRVSDERTPASRGDALPEKEAQKEAQQSGGGEKSAGERWLRHSAERATEPPPPQQEVARVFSAEHELGVTLPEQKATAEMARVYVDGTLQRRWRFELSHLPRGHLVSVARGPPDAAIDAHGEFKGSFGQLTLSNDEMFSRLAAPTPPFRLLKVADLVPESHLDEYRRTLLNLNSGLISENQLRTTPEPPRGEPQKIPPTPDWFNPANASGYRDDIMGGNLGFGGGSHAGQDECTIS
ncbi:hypothetical protein AB1Y20_018610 [Prymnesium parvum]|uniref:holo-[acyl-carrier-protein] synthase n=1 Tax=Prymnesium parvum TaxID=97485 RepID=A0AB34JQD3_PRYPA